MAAWGRVLRPGDLFVDIGASIGLYTFWAASLGAVTIAVEADTETLDKLHENVALNPTLPITVVAAAATDTAGTAKFAGGRRAVSALGGGTETPATTIDALLDGRWARGVKIDVEGHEYTVLRGASDALEHRRIDVIQIEWNRRSREAVGSDRRPIRDMLLGYGYRLARPDLSGRFSETDAADFGGDVFALADPALLDRAAT